MNMLIIALGAIVALCGLAIINRSTKMTPIEKLTLQALDVLLERSAGFMERSAGSSNSALMARLRDTQVEIKRALSFQTCAECLCPGWCRSHGPRSAGVCSRELVERGARKCEHLTCCDQIAECSCPPRSWAPGDRVPEWIDEKNYGKVHVKRTPYSVVIASKGGTTILALEPTEALQLREALKDV